MVVPKFTFELLTLKIKITLMFHSTTEKCSVFHVICKDGPMTACSFVSLHEYYGVDIFIISFLSNISGSSVELRLLSSAIRLVVTKLSKGGLSPLLTTLAFILFIANTCSSSAFPQVQNRLPGTHPRPHFPLLICSLNPHFGTGLYTPLNTNKFDNWGMHILRWFRVERMLSK